MEQESSINLVQNDNFLQKAYQVALIPSILSILSGCVNIIADGILVGHKIGADGLAAINLCVPVYLILCIVGSLLVSGAAICSSREIGKNNMNQAMLFYRSAITTCLIASVIMAVVGMILSDSIAFFLCGDAAILPMVRDYTLVTFVGAFPQILIYIPFWYLRLDGRNKSVVIMMTLMAAGNVILDIIFLYGLQMGVFGAALASVVATAAACLFGFVSLSRGNFHFLPGFVLPGKTEFKEIAVVGSPAAMNNLFQTLRLLCVNALLLEYGGSIMVAVFSVINGISAFAEAVTVGVPQAGTAMLGIYHGERDNESTGLLLRLEAKWGVLCSLIFGVGIVAGADLIEAAYGMNLPMQIPMLCLAVSLVLSLWNNILSAYYSVADYVWLSNLLIFLRVFIFPAACLLILLEIGATPWLFLAAGEAFTILVWYAVTGIMHGRDAMKSRYFLMDQQLEKTGNVINFSMISDKEKICEAGEKITDFCTDNGMQAKQVIRVSLALEEMMTLVTAVNEPQQILFDIRVFAVQDVIGIRIRYTGNQYNPLAQEQKSDEEDELYMGMRMLQKLVEEVVYLNTFGMNTLLILL